MRILGIETSCDETAVAIYSSQGGLLAHQLYSQAKLHAQYGGVVPELASRDHVQKLTHLTQATLEQAGVTQVDGVACTTGPGLIGALLVGASFARSLAFAWRVPYVGVNHLESHLLAPMLEPEPPSFPFLALLVSGGHTLLAEVQGLGQYQVLGETLDDAAGEAFDKTAKLLGLGYPGGPELARLAEQGQTDAYHFPRPMVDRPGLDFSFSGLKTYTLNVWQNSQQDQTTRANIAAAFQEAVVDTLFIKCKRALQQTHSTRLVVAGGVGANQLLRQRLKQLPAQVYYPRIEFCTDNAAMVAYLGWLYLTKGVRQSSMAIEVRARWPFAMAD